MLNELSPYSFREAHPCEREGYITRPPLRAHQVRYSMPRPRYGIPTAAEVRQAAQAAVQIFGSHGLSCCLVGGMACLLFGNSRTPTVRVPHLIAV